MARILVVDDDDEMRHLTLAALEQAGHSVTVTGDGRTAFELLEQSDFDVLLTDMHMPGTDGMELTRLVRTRLSAPRIIGMTGNDIANTLRMVELLGARATLHKPFTVEQLLEAVRSALS